MKNEIFDNEDSGMIIMATDLPGKTAAISAPGAGEVAAAPDPLAGVVQTGEADPFGRAPEFSIGTLGKKVLDLFVQRHPGEIEAIHAKEIRLVEVKNKHQGLTDAVAHSRLILEQLENEIRPYLGPSIAEAIYRGKCNLGHRIENLIYGSAQNPSEVLLALVLQKEGEKVLKFARDEYEAWQKKLGEFEKTERPLLKELGLI